MKNIVILSGAGVSAESGLNTFRDDGGLWENHNVYDVATPEAWERDPALVLRFYNERRKKTRDAKPNAAHLALVRLEKQFRVHIITQNVDDLHERAGSSQVMHLHGKIDQSRSSIDPNLVYEVDHWEMKIGEKCEKNSQLRPNIVWFGESVPMIDQAIPLMKQADIVIVIGTSLKVYPAAGLLNYTSPAIPKYYVDPNGFPDSERQNLKVISEKAGEGVPPLVQSLLEEAE